MTHSDLPAPDAAFHALADGRYQASALTRGPWDPAHQHAGPPIALVCRAVEQAGHAHGLTHVSRITANLLRPLPIAALGVEVRSDYVGRNTGHFSAQLTAHGKEVARFTLLMQRESELELPAGLVNPALPQDLPGPDASPATSFPFASRSRLGYADLVETRLARGRFFDGPCVAWFRLRHPLVAGEQPSPYQSLAVAADSGNGISAVLDFGHYLFLNSDLSIHLLRRPRGEWIALDARTQLGTGGCGLTESRLYDAQGLVGTAIQSLLVRPRVHAPHPKG